KTREEESPGLANLTGAIHHGFDFQTGVHRTGRGPFWHRRYHACEFSGVERKSLGPADWMPGLALALDAQGACYVRKDDCQDRRDQAGAVFAHWLRRRVRVAGECEGSESSPGRSWPQSREQSLHNG